MKKDLIIGTLRTIIGTALLSYVVYLYVNHVDIVPAKEWGFDITILTVIGIISIVMIYMGVIKPCLKKPRITMAIMGVFLILFPYYVGIQDNYLVHNYLGDILRVIGSIAVVMSFGKLCVYDKCSSVEKQIESGEMEIIEV